MISWPVSRSRLPVGSSASRRRGTGDQGPGDGRPLHLAAGELAREVIQAMAQADGVEQLDGVARTASAAGNTTRRRGVIISGARTFSSIVSSGSR